MKKISFLILLLFMAGTLHAQLTAYFSRCAFSTPDHKPYIETYLAVMGNSVAFKKNTQGKFQGQVEVGIIFSRNGEIKASKKYTLLSPEQKDTLNRPNFIDQQRFALDTGEYELEAMITDKNRTNGKTFSMKEKLKIGFPAGKVAVSDIEMLSSFTKTEVKGPLTKNGYDLVPYSSNFYPENITELAFYAEVYNSKEVFGENEKFLLTYYIESFESKTQLSNFTVFRKETSNPVNIILSKFDILNLPSGNYNLVVEVRSKENGIVAYKKSFFQRKNTKAKMNLNDLSAIAVENTFAARITGKDTLMDILRSLYPIATGSEKSFLDNQLKLADAKLMQQFLYNFWQSRSALAPEAAWNKYAQDVKAVNAKFGTLSYRGYETDRGRIYLQYGPPDKREESPSEPNAYPYETWLYYKLNDKSGVNPPQTNKQFIFYNPELATNNYQLLHSDAQGELHDARWDMKLHKRTVQSHDFEKTDAPSHYGGNTSEEIGKPK